MNGREILLHLLTPPMSMHIPPSANIHQDIEGLRKDNQEAALYAIPFGFRVRCLFKMDFAEVEYISKLRSGVKGHWSYRTVAWEMKQQMLQRHPYLGGLIQATSPDVEDSLTR